MSLTCHDMLAIRYVTGGIYPARIATKTMAE